jgi:hypothetical protein
MLEHRGRKYPDSHRKELGGPKTATEVGRYELKRSTFSFHPDIHLKNQ